MIKNPPSRMGGRHSLGVQDGQVHTAVFEMDHQQGPTIAHGTLFNVTWQSGWEGSLGKNGYMYMHG